MRGPLFSLLMAGRVVQRVGRGRAVSLSLFSSFAACSRLLWRHESGGLDVGKVFGGRPIYCRLSMKETYTLCGTEVALL